MDRMSKRTTIWLLLLMGALGIQPGVTTSAWAQEQQVEAAEEGWITVRPGDTLFSIARRHEVSVSDLQSWNELPDSGIRAGMRLRIAPPDENASAIEQGEAQDQEQLEAPTDTTGTAASSNTPESESSASNAPAEESLDVSARSVTPLSGGVVAVSLAPGETLTDLADRLELPADSVIGLNPGFPVDVRDGMVAVVPDDRVTRVRTVKRGDTLFSIAREEGVSVARIREMNSLRGNTIQVGQRLNVPSSGLSVDGDQRLPGAGEFPMRAYPDALTGRTLSEGRTYRPEAFLIGHPSLAPGSFVLISTQAGLHVFAEVVETAPARTPEFIEGSMAVFEALGIEPGDVAIIHHVH